MTSTAYNAYPVQKYDATTIVLHWLIALILVGNGVLALVIDAWPKDQRPPIVNLHAVFGVLLLALTLWRIANRVAKPTPPLPPGPAWMEMASKAAQGLLYLLTLLLPISGMVMMQLRGRGVDFGIFQIPVMLTENRDTARSVKEVHELMFWGAMAIAGLHALAALWHQFGLKDRLLERMKF